MGRVPTCLGALCAVGFLPSVALAWTEAHVHSVQAHVDIDRDGHARVGMTIAVQVHGGWLEGLEIAGLDPNLQVSADKPPTLVDAEGRKHETSYQARSDGRVLLRFTGRRSPRRGNYTIDILYTVDLDDSHFTPMEDGEIEIAWTLPGWRSGLDGVEVALTVPGVAHGIAETESDNSIDHARFEHATSTTLTWHRVHLPLTMPWRVALRVPEEALAPRLRAASQVVRALPPPVYPEPRRWPVGAMLGAAACLLALSKRWLFIRASREVGASRRSLVPMPGELTRWLAIIAAAASTYWFDSHGDALGTLCALTAILFLTIERGARQRIGAGVEPSRWNDVREAEIENAHRQRRRSRWWGLGATDVTQPGSWLWITAGVIGLAWLFEETNGESLVIQGGMLVLSLFAVTTSHQLPRSAGEVLLSLRRFAPPNIARLVVCQDDGNRWLDARVRFEVDPPIDGLIRCDLALGRRWHLGGYRYEPHVLIVTRADTAADSQVRRLLPTVRAETARHGWVARNWPASDDPKSDIEWLLTELRDAAEVADTICDEGPDPSKCREVASESRQTMCSSY